MKIYELTYLISSSLLEEETRPLQEKIASFVQAKEGLLIDEGKVIKKKLAYPIKKKGGQPSQQQAYLATLNFQLKPECLGDFDANLKAEDNILRYIIITRKPRSLKHEARRTREIHPTKETEESAQKKKVELKEIDKKIDEILGE